MRISIVIVTQAVHNAIMIAFMQQTDPFNAADGQAEAEAVPETEAEAEPDAAELLAQLQEEQAEAKILKRMPNPPKSKTAGCVPRSYIEAEAKVEGQAFQTTEAEAEEALYIDGLFLP